MAETLKVLAQLTPSATTLTDCYTVPGATKAAISSISVCNRSTAATFRISVAIAGAANDNKQYIYYDTPIPANETLMATVGISLGAADVIRVYASSANLSFNIFGIEIT
jgi:hypothetical protein